MPTFYTGSSFSIDNVFFYKTYQTPETSELGEYTTKSLDADGKSYFDFAGKDFIIFSTNGSVTEKMKQDDTESILLDCRDGVGGNKFNNWADGNTYMPGTQSGSISDSFGGDEGWIDLVTNGGWTGAALSTTTVSTSPFSTRAIGICILPCVAPTPATIR